MQQQEVPLAQISQDLMAENMVREDAQLSNGSHQGEKIAYPTWSENTRVVLTPSTNSSTRVLHSKPRVKHTISQIKPKTIKKYQVAIICRAALEILAMNSMKRSDRAMLMEHKVLDHALAFDKYAEGVNAQNVRTKMPKDLWRKFEEVRRVVVNEIQPVFLDFMKGAQLRSGLGEADICKAEFETRKALFARTKSMKGQAGLSGYSNLTEKNKDDKDLDDIEELEEFNESWFPTEWIPFTEFGMPAKVRNQSWNENFTFISSEGPDSSNVNWKEPSASLAKPRFEYSRSEAKRKRTSLQETDGSTSSGYEIGEEDKELGNLQHDINTAVHDLAKYRKIHQLNLAISFSQGERKENYIKMLLELVDADIEGSPSPLIQ